MGTEGGRRKAVGEHVRCSCCGRTRFWSELGTFTTDLSSDFDLADGTLTQTVLYCRDDSGCRGTAQTLRLIHSAPIAASGDPGRLRHDADGAEFGCRVPETAYSDPISERARVRLSPVR